MVEIEQLVGFRHDGRVEMSFEQKKKALHILYKRYINGLVKEKELTPRQKSLLCKYYGLTFRMV